MPTVPSSPAIDMESAKLKLRQIARGTGGEMYSRAMFRQGEEASTIANDIRSRLPPSPPDTYLLMAAASLHEQGRLVTPSAIPRDAKAGKAPSQ